MMTSIALLTMEFGLALGDFMMAQAVETQHISSDNLHTFSCVCD